MSCTCNNFFVAKLYIYRGRMVFSLCSVFIDHLFLCASEWQHITTFHAKTCNIPRTQFSLILLIKNKQSSRGQNKLNDTQNTQKMIYKRNIRLYDVTVGKKTRMSIRRQWLVVQREGSWEGTVTEQFDQTSFLCAGADWAEDLPVGRILAWRLCR